MKEVQRIFCIDSDWKVYWKFMIMSYMSTTNLPDAIHLWFFKPKLQGMVSQTRTPCQRGTLTHKIEKSHPLFITFSICHVSIPRKSAQTFLTSIWFCTLRGISVNKDLGAHAPQKRAHPSSVRKSMSKTTTKIPRSLMSKVPAHLFERGWVSVTNTSSRRSTSKLMTIQNCLVRTTL